MKKIIRLLYIFFLVVFIMINNCISVSANAGPPHEITDGDAEFLIPIKHSDIEIYSEVLYYKINNFTDNTMTADITAEYTMHNSGNEKINVLAAFVSNNPELTPTILFNSKTVEILRTERINWERYAKRDWNNFDDWKDFGIWEPNFEKIMFYFSTGNISEEFVLISDYCLEVTLFEITFEPDEICRLNVSYSENSAFITDRFGYSSGHNPRFQFYYLLEPAKYWKDFNDLTIYVELPKKLLTVFSLEGFKLNKETNIYTAHFNKLPDKNLEILVYKNNHIESSKEVHIKTALKILLFFIVFIVVIVLFIVGMVKLIIKLVRYGKGRKL